MLQKINAIRQLISTPAENTHNYGKNPDINNKNLIFHNIAASTKTPQLRYLHTYNEKKKYTQLIHFPNIIKIQNINWCNIAESNEGIEGNGIHNLSR